MSKTRIISGSSLLAAFVVVILRDTFTWLYEKFLAYITPSKMDAAMMPEPATILGLVLGIGGILILAWPTIRKKFWGPKAPPAVVLEIVNGVDYTGRSVKIDGKHFINCTFRNSTVQYNGGHYQLTECHRHPGTTKFLTTNPAIMNAMPILKFLGLMNESTEGGSYVIEGDTVTEHRSELKPFAGTVKE